jgi:adenylate cyclase
VKRAIWFKLAVSVVIAVSITGLAWAGLGAHVFAGYQLRLTDALFPSIAPDPRVVVVAIDDESLARIGQWPWPRIQHARLLDRLAESGAELVGYDVTFSEPRPGYDDDLGAAATRSGNVVFTATATFRGKPGDILRARQLFAPVGEITAGAVLVGHANVIPDPDGVVRALPQIIETPREDLLPSLSFALFQLHEGLSGPLTVRPDGVQLGDRLVPTGRSHFMDVNFAEGFPTYSFIDVVEGDVPSEAFRGKIVLVGATALGLGDTRLTPLDKGTGEAGVLIHASALNTMLQGAFLIPQGRSLTLLWVFAVALLVALAVAFLRIWLSPIVAGALGVGYFLLAFLRFDGGSVMNVVYPPIAIPLAYLAALAVRYFTEERERRRVTRVFGRYVAHEVVDEVLAAPERALATLEGASRPLSVLFADLRGFTSASEGVQPTEVVKALNVYLDAMVRAVNNERGTVDKFMGDCVMAFWGAPRPEPDHAAQAVRAGMRMLDEIDRAVAEGRASGLEVAGCGVGVATGEAVVGNIGSHERLDYTVIGDTVNTASRLCGVAGPGQLVVTEECAARLGEEFRLGPLPPLSVKGKMAPLRVFQVLREGQEPAEVIEGAVLEYLEEKGSFEQTAPAKAAGYAPIEPRSEPQDEPRPAG